ncbi:peptide chain release factor N(5)-glutamine methyltransferase [Arcanobacterium haemolyticum]|nr:peptide chain release factor N(5)-glutamine methyltransferase [Arcanobacterium haemolyticum]
MAQAADRLERSGVPSPHVDAREIAEYVAGDRHRLEGGASPDEVEVFLGLINRRCERVPLQHLTGRMYFRYLELVSRPGVFIVRPETEMVAEAAIAAARKAENPRVVDLCTGSAAIALALATEVRGAQVTGVEISAEALSVARDNNARYGSPVTLVHDDALAWLPEVRVDVVVSNPPYVPASTAHEPEVEADPAIALWGGGEDGLTFPVALIKHARSILTDGGILIMEHAEAQSEALREAARLAGYVDVSTGRDLTGRERWLQARWPGGRTGRIEE